MDEELQLLPKLEFSDAEADMPKRRQSSSIFHQRYSRRSESEQSSKKLNKAGFSEDSVDRKRGKAQRALAKRGNFHSDL